MAKKYIDTTKEAASKKGSFFFVVNTWNIGVLVIVGHKQKDVERISKKRFPDLNWESVPGVDQSDCPAGRVVSNASGTILFLENWPTKIYHYGVLAHEIFHIADMSLRFRGVTLSDDSDEAYAYLIEDLTRRMLVKFSI